MVEESRSDPMVACYIQSSYPAMLYFAYKYADNFETAILASANAGSSLYFNLFLYHLSLISSC